MQSLFARFLLAVSHEPTWSWGGAVFNDDKPVSSVATKRRRATVKEVFRFLLDKEEISVNDLCWVTFSQDEPIYNHAAARGRHIRQCAYGQEQWVWGAGGHQEVCAPHCGVCPKLACLFSFAWEPAALGSEVQSRLQGSLTDEKHCSRKK